MTHHKAAYSAVNSVECLAGYLADYLVEQSAAMKARMKVVHSVDILVVLMIDTTADSMEFLMTMFYGAKSFNQPLGG